VGKYPIIYKVLKNIPVVGKYPIIYKVFKNIPGGWLFGISESSTVCFQVGGEVTPIGVFFRLEMGWHYNGPFGKGLAFVDVPQNRPTESSENCFLKLRSSFDGEYFGVFIFSCPSPQQSPIWWQSLLNSVDNIFRLKTW